MTGMDQLLRDAKTLVQRLQSHDNSADSLISEATHLQNKLHAMKQYRDEVSKLNEIAKHRPKSTLILGSQLENQRIQELEFEVGELTVSLAEHQSSLELIMNKYREQVLSLLEFNGLDKGVLDQVNREAEDVKGMKEKILEMAAIMQKAMRIDDAAANREIEALQSLQSENETLRELLQISGRSSVDTSTVIRRKPKHEKSGNSLTATPKPLSPPGRSYHPPDLNKLRNPVTVVSDGPGEFHNQHKEYQEGLSTPALGQGKFEYDDISHHQKADENRNDNANSRDSSNSSSEEHLLHDETLLTKDNTIPNSEEMSATTVQDSHNKVDVINPSLGAAYDLDGGSDSSEGIDREFPFDDVLSRNGYLENKTPEIEQDDHSTTWSSSSDDSGNPLPQSAAEQTKNTPLVDDEQARADMKSTEDALAMLDNVLLEDDDSDDDDDDDDDDDNAEAS